MPPGSYPRSPAIGHVEGGDAIAVPALRQGLTGNQEVVALLGLGELGGCRYLGQARGAGALNLRGRGLEARLGKVQVGALCSASSMSASSCGSP